VCAVKQTSQLSSTVNVAVAAVLSATMLLSSLPVLSTVSRSVSVQAWARYRDETETRRLQVSRRDRDVEMHVVINAVAN